MRSLLLASSAVIALLPCAAFAQASAPAEPKDSTGLEEIIVTAQRRAESAQKAAVAINVIGGGAVTDAGVTQVAALGSLVPALTLQQIGGSTSAFIRGVGNFAVAATADPAVAFNYDGVYVGRINSTNGTFYDLARVEVLKGPQGTLYGRNATAGVINVIPTQPILGELSGYGSVSYGNYSALAAEAAVNIPLGDKGAMRVSATITDRDGYLSNGISDDKTQAFRVQFKTEATPNLTLRLAFDYTHLGGKGPGFTFLNRHVFNTTTQQYVVTPTNISRSESFLSPASQAFYTTLGAGAIGQVRATRDPFPDIFRNNHFYGATGEIIWKTGAGVLTVIPSVRFDQIKNINPAGGFQVSNDQKSLQYSLETRFAGKAGMFDYTLGFFYFNEDVKLRQGSVTFGSNASFNAPTKLTTESYAPFARLTANVSDKLRLVGGIRYTHDAKTIDSTLISVVYGCRINFTCTNTTLPPLVFYPEELPYTLPVLGQPIQTAVPTANTVTITRSPDGIFVGSQNIGKFTYRGAVEFDVGPASMLFASVETGFRSGGFNTAVGLETYQPEFITAFTVGSKNRFFDNRLQLNLEAFYWKYRDQQVAHGGVDRSTPPRASSIVENVGSSTIKGFEIEAKFKATPTTTLSGDFQYLDAVNDFFSFDIPVAQRIRTGCVTTASATAGFLNINCAGLPGYNSPKWTINLAVEQIVPVGEYEVVIGADTQYKTERYMGFDYQPEQLQPASWTSNAQIAFGPANKKWKLSAFVRNIENERLIATPFSFAGVLVAYTTPPRTYGMRATMKF